MRGSVEVEGWSRSVEVDGVRSVERVNERVE